MSEVKGYSPSQQQPQVRVFGREVFVASPVGERQRVLLSADGVFTPLVAHFSIVGQQLSSAGEVQGFLASELGLSSSSDSGALSVVFLDTSLGRAEVVVDPSLLASWSVPAALDLVRRMEALHTAALSCVGVSKNEIVVQCNGYYGSSSASSSFSAVGLAVSKTTMYLEVDLGATMGNTGGSLLCGIDSVGTGGGSDSFRVFVPKQLPVITFTPPLVNLTVGTKVSFDYDEWFLGSSSEAQYVVAVDGVVVRHTRVASFSLNALPEGDLVIQVGVQGTGGGVGSGSSNSNNWITSQTFRGTVQVITSPGEASTVAESIVSQIGSGTGSGTAEEVSAEVVGAAQVVEQLGQTAIENGTAGDVGRVLQAVDGLGTLSATGEAKESVVALTDSLASSLLAHNGTGDISFSGTVLKIAVTTIGEATSGTATVRLENSTTSVALPGLSGGGRVLVKAAAGDLYPVPGNNETSTGDVVQVRVSSFGGASANEAVTMKVNFTVDAEFVDPYPCNIALRVWNETTGSWEPGQDLQWNGFLSEGLLTATAQQQQNPSCGGSVTYRAAVVLAAGNNNGTVELTGESKLGTVGAFIASEVMPATNLKRLFSSSNFNSWTQLSAVNIPTLTVVGTLYLLYYILFVVTYFYDRRQDAGLVNNKAAPSERARLKQEEKVNNALALPEKKWTLPDFGSTFHERLTSGLTSIRAVDIEEMAAEGHVFRWEDGVRECKEGNYLRAAHIFQHQKDKPCETFEEAKAAAIQQAMELNKMVREVARFEFSKQEAMLQQSIVAEEYFTPKANKRMMSHDLPFAQSGSREEVPRIMSIVSEDSDTANAHNGMIHMPPAIRAKEKAQRLSVAQEENSPKANRKPSPHEKYKTQEVPNERAPRVVSIVSEDLSALGGIHMPPALKAKKQRHEYSPKAITGIPPALIPKEQTTCPNYEEHSAPVLTLDPQLLGFESVPSPCVSASSDLFTETKSNSNQADLDHIDFEEQHDGMDIPGGLPGKRKSVAGTNLSSMRKVSVTATEEEAIGMNCCDNLHLFASKAAIALRAHLWFCVLFRQPGQSFSRPQRLAVLFAAMNTVFFICAVFHGRNENGTIAKTIMVAVISACMMTPTTVLLGLLFKRAVKKVPVLWSWAALDPYPEYPILGELNVRVVQARDLSIRGEAMDDIPDCFVLVESECRVWKSATVWDDHNPVFDGSCVVSYPVREEKESVVVVNVYDDDGLQEIGTEDLVASLSISMQDIIDCIVRDDSSATASLDCWYQIPDEVSKKQGRNPEIRLICEYTQYNTPEYQSISHKEWWEAKKLAEVKEKDRLDPNFSRRMSPMLSSGRCSLASVFSPTLGSPKPVFLTENETIPMSPTMHQGGKQVALPVVSDNNEAGTESPVSEEELELTLCQRANKQAGRSVRLIIFLVFVHVGIVFLIGYKWWPLVASFFLILSIATYFFQLAKAVALLLMSLGMYGCVLMIDSGEVGIGVALLFLWVMIFVALGVSSWRPRLLPMVLSVFWSVHLFIVLCLYYEVEWWAGAGASCVQIVAALGCWWVMYQRYSMGHLGSAVFVLQWSGCLFVCLEKQPSIRREGSKVEVGGTEQWLAPLVFLLVGWLVVLRSYQLKKGGLLPQHLPHHVTYLAYALAFFIQLSSVTIFLTEALRWEQETQQSFFTGCAIAFMQDIVLNEPMKLLVLTYADPIAKTFLKSGIGKAFSTIMKETGITKMLRAVLGG